jgi:hypothetical protein
MSVIAVTALAAAVLPAEALQRGSAPPVRFANVQYDSPGQDTGSNKSLNKEWIKLHNHSNKAKKLKGWTIRDTSGHVYHFKKFTLKPGKTVALHTGSGSNNSSNVYWHADDYVWNNSGDKAILKSSNGKKIDVCKWSSGSGSTQC